MDQEELSNAEKRVIELILSAVQDTEPYGVMGSELYISAVEETGCPLHCFTAVLSTLVDLGVLERHGNCYCRSTRLSPTVEQSLAE
jgi:hypothetical protein